MKVNNAGNALEFGNATQLNFTDLIYLIHLQQFFTMLQFKQLVVKTTNFILGEQQKTLELLEGNTYIFDHPSAHPLHYCSTDSGNSSAYTTPNNRIFN